MLTQSLQQDLAVVTFHEVEALVLEIFTSTYGCDWQTAIEEALATIVDLAHYAADWDAQVGPGAAAAGDWDTAFAALRVEADDGPTVRPFCFFCPGAAHNTRGCPKLDEAL